MTMQTFTGREYLKIDIANNFGHDKRSWDYRIEWFDLNEPNLENLVSSADEPALFYAGVKAYRDVQAGKPIGYMVSLDATSSGLQILAALTGDRMAAQLCNVVDTGYRNDAYTIIYDEMIQRTGGQAKITRDDTKQAIMTSLYGSTAMPKQVFGEGVLLRCFYEVMEDSAPGAWELNKAMLGFWDPTATTYNWVMPDNFHINTKVMDTVKEIVNFLNEPFEVTHQVNQPMEEGRSLGANMVHSIDGMIVREMVRRCSYDRTKISKVERAVEQALSGAGDNRAVTDNDKTVITLWDHYQKSGYLSARILDHLELENIGHVDPAVILELLSSLPDKPFYVVPVHDCFRVLPHYGDDLRKQYNLQLSLIAKSRLLEDLLLQIVKKPIAVSKLDPNLHADILASNYALS